MTPWTVVLQAPLLLGFSRQEYWNGLPFPPPPGDLPDPEIEPRSPVVSCAGSRFFTTEPSEKPYINIIQKQLLKDFVGCNSVSNAICTVPSCFAKSLQSCPTLCDPIDGSPPGSPVPRILQARTTGVGCHFLLQCMKVKSESEVSQSCQTLCDRMDCSPPGSSIHGIFQAKSTGVGWHCLQNSLLLFNFSVNLKLF